VVCDVYIWLLYDLQSFFFARVDLQSFCQVETQMMTGHTIIQQGPCMRQAVPESQILPLTRRWIMRPATGLHR
jgi:hypothetical protein